MSYLDRLKKLKSSSIGTAITAKRAFDSKGSSDVTRFQEIDKVCPLTKPAGRPRLPKWCNPGCDWYHEWDGSAWCYDEADANVWRRWEVNTMQNCPKLYDTKVKPGG